MPNTPVSAYPLHPTPHRRAFLRAVNEPYRIVWYRSARTAYDDRMSTVVTARLKEAFNAGWIEPIPAEELPQYRQPTAERMGLTFYRLTDYGRIAMRGAKSSIDKEQSNG